ncbi:MAG: dual specificity protein phosphatase family protein [Alphaproteobacteria bacterium]|nr:dual specificity protein phosphatase family protein [Alphaproteobacteria bacterium]
MVPHVVKTPGGGTIGLSAFPQLHELQDFRFWRVTALVTLVEQRELMFLGSKDLGKMVASAGLAWHHLPVPDMGEPDQAFEQLWAKSGPVLRKTLRSGGKIIVHCRAGLGRTGMIAARLLVELGMAPDQAIAAVRTARPGSIETAEQEEHVRACKAIDEK